MIINGDEDDAAAMQPQRLAELIHECCRRLYPLCSESAFPSCFEDLPRFLKGRIDFEIKKGTFGFTAEVVRVLCEVSPPKTHVVDMARNCVMRAKLADELLVSLGRMHGDLLCHVTDLKNDKIPAEVRIKNAISRLETEALIIASRLRSSQIS